VTPGNPVPTIVEFLDDLVCDVGLGLRHQYFHGVIVLPE